MRRALLCRGAGHGAATPAAATNFSFPSPLCPAGSHGPSPASLQPHPSAGGAASRRAGVLRGSRRHIFIRISETPNAECKKFALPGGEPFMREGTREYLGANVAYGSPLAMFIFEIAGVRGVMVGPDFVSVTKEGRCSWMDMGPRVCEAITAFAQSGQPAVSNDGEGVAYPDTHPSDDDSDALQAIKELIAGEVRPMVQRDGGDLRLVGYDEGTGAVLVTLQGACSSCTSSSDTLRENVQRTLQHWLPEVAAVVRVTAGYAEEFRDIGCIEATGRSLEELVEEMAAEHKAAAQAVADAEGGGGVDADDPNDPDADLKWQVRGGGGGACSK